MKPPATPRSLFWAFAGVFLLVLAVATTLQVLVSVTLIRPLERSSELGSVEAALSGLAIRVAALPDSAGDAAVRALLRQAEEDVQRRHGFLYVRADGRLVAESPVPAEVATQLGRELPAAADGGGDGSPHDPPGPTGAAPPATANRRLPLELMARRIVASDGHVLGELFALRPGVRDGRGLAPEARTLLLFLPFAVLAAGGAGLLMVRLLVRRLRALESSLARVERGDLGARVEERALDEIGRLEERFNRMTESLEAARAHAIEVDEQRRSLLSDIAHELATPLTSIRGYVETLLDPAVPKTDQERATYLRDVLEESKRLDVLTRDLLDLVRLEAGATLLKKERLDWLSLARNAARRWEPRLRDAGLALAWAGGPGEAWVHADGRRLEQALENLLGNALRYVPRGGTVTLALGRIVSEGGERFELSVGDDGPGIGAAELPHVFERFWRGTGARTSSVPGLGLGLAIVREIMLAHGGCVRAEANEPRGVRFVLELPGEQG